jgi:probable phosphoglycerate mutase
LDLDLTPESYQMAEDFAQAYQDLPWQAVYSSPLKRAITAYLSEQSCSGTALG